MRTIDSILSAALAAGNGRPIVKATIGKMDGTVIHTQEVISYKLTARQLEFEMKYQGDLGSTQTAIWLERGVTLNGADYTITTGKFRIWSQTYLPNGRQRTVGGIFPKQYYSAAGDVSYQTVIAAICTAFGKTAVFRNPAAAWLAYQFLPAGKVLIMNDANNVFNMLRQKYLIFACDNGSEEILFYAHDASGIGAADETVTVNADFDLQLSKLKNRQFLWRDEAETVHTQGSADDPIHNLGYLESTDSAPARMTPTYIMSATTRPRLEVQDGDIVSLEMPLATSKMFAQVTEELKPSTTNHQPPTWCTTIQANPIFENTEGGALPSTIERVSNYTPLNTSMFDGNLSASDNNLQAAMDTIDNLVLGGTPPVTSVNGKTGAVVLVPTDIGSREVLTANRTYYVRTDGNDANSGLINSAGGAFLTIQKAIDVAATLDLSVYNITIQIVNGTYNCASIILKTCIGAGYVTIVGDETTPSNVVINQNSGANGQANFSLISVPTVYKLRGMRLTAATVTNPFGLYVQGGYVEFQNLEFGTTFYDHMRVSVGGYLKATGNYAIIGGATHHQVTTQGGQYYGAGITVTLTGTPAFTTFAVADAISNLVAHANTYSGGATGQRYNVSMNSIIFTNSGGANYFPGNSAGASASGGQYI